MEELDSSNDWLEALLSPTQPDFSVGTAEPSSTTTSKRRSTKDSTSGHKATTPAQLEAQRRWRAREKQSLQVRRASVPSLPEPNAGL